MADQDEDPIAAEFDINKYLPHGAKGYRDFIMGEIKRGIIKGVWVGFVLGVIGTFCAFMIMNYLMGAK